MDDAQERRELRRQQFRREIEERRKQRDEDRKQRMYGDEKLREESEKAAHLEVFFWSLGWLKIYLPILFLILVSNKEFLLFVSIFCTCFLLLVFFFSLGNMFFTGQLNFVINGLKNMCDDFLSYFEGEEEENV